MDIKTFEDYYLEPISISSENRQKPLPQIFKDVAELQISPDEQITDTKKKYTFTNKNLDIITIPHEAYLYITASHVTTSGTSAADKQAKMTKTNTIAIPSSAGLIDSYDYLINDTTICTQNNSLASTLYAVNNGLYASSSKYLEHIGLSNPNVGTINLQSKKYGTSNHEWIIPLKLFIPFLKDNKILWGVKQTLKITRADITNAIYELDGGALPANFAVNIKNIELRMPYIKLENETQKELWSSMYAKNVDRYWLDVDQFWSDQIDNSSARTNETFKVATKGLNSKPRYLLLHAVQDTGNNLEKNKPMGFGNDDLTTYNDNSNTMRFKKLRVKINGIYVDNGNVMEFICVDAQNKTAPANAADITDPSDSTKTIPDPAKSDKDNSPYRKYRDFFTAYDDYCKFFGQYYSKRDSVKSFVEWLKEQLFVFDLTNIDGEQIFQNSGNSLIIEIEYSTYKGVSTSATNKTFKLVANVLYDKQLSIMHSENKAVLTLT